MRTFLWLTTVVLVAAGLGVVAVADYADRHPSSALNEGLARMALAWTGTKATPATTPPCCDESQCPATDAPCCEPFVGIEPEIDDTLLRELKIISELGTVPELIPVDPIEVTDEGSAGTKFGTETADEFSPTTPEEPKPRRKIWIKASEDGRAPRNREEYKNEAPLTPGEFVENLKKTNPAHKEHFERIGVDFNVSVGPKPLSIECDLDIPINPTSFNVTPAGDCPACGVCAMLCSFCDCMSQFVAGLLGSSVEVEVGVCHDHFPPPTVVPFPCPPEFGPCPGVPCTPPTPADVFMMLTCPRGLPPECCVPLPPMPPMAAGQVIVPVHHRLPNGQFYVTYTACPHPALAPMPYPAPPQGYPHPVPMQPTLAPGQFVQLPCPPPMPATPAVYGYPAPRPSQPGVMQAQFAVPPPPCQPCQPPVFAQWRPGQPVPTPTAPLFNVQFPYAPPMPAPMAATRATCCASPRTDKGFAKEVSVEFKDQPLCEVLEQFREMADINIVCDKPALDANGNAMDQPVTLKLNKVPCRVALKHALNHCGLVCKVEDDVVIVTTSAKALGGTTACCEPCPAVCPVTIRAAAAIAIPCPTSCPPQPSIAVAPCSDAPCNPPCAKGTCPRECCEKDACAKECEANVIAPRIRLDDGTIVQIEIKIIKAMENANAGLKQASFDIETLEAVPAVTHPKDLPGAEHPDDLPNGGHIDGFGAREGWDVIRSIAVARDAQVQPEIPAWVLQAMESGKPRRLPQMPRDEQASDESQIRTVIYSRDAMKGVQAIESIAAGVSLYAQPVQGLVQSFWPF